MSELTIGKSKNTANQQSTPVSFVSSQLVLFHSRKKWGIIYALATVAGLFCVPGGLVAMATETDALVMIARSVPLPVASFLVIVGMYVLNDLVDADLDRANGKKRPIPAGQVSKLQARFFVVSTNGIGMLLACLTLNPMSVIIVSLVVVIGLMYSAPRISLKDRFIVKTLAIALALVLCSIMGITVSFGLNLNASAPIVSIYAALMLGAMVFITSPFNDLGDVAGDKAAGRRTIPIVIGRENTIRLAMFLAIGMFVASWLLYQVIGLFMSALVSSVAVLTIINMSKTLKRLDDVEFVRKQHKKSLPLHIMLQSALIIGSLLA